MEKEISGERFILRIAASMAFVLSVVHGLAVANNWYRTVPSIDIPIHAGWTATFGFVIYWLIERYPGHINLGENLFVTILVGLSLSALGGVVWEFIEFAYDFFGIDFGIPKVQFGIGDTLLDMLSNMLGGVSVAIFAWVRYHRKRK